MSGLKYARRPIRDLVRQLEYRSTFGRPCYVKRNTVHAAIIVPSLRNGADGPYEYWRTFQRATVHEAIVLGLVVLGDALGDVPEFSGPASHWSMSSGHMGRTIRFPGVAK